MDLDALEALVAFADAGNNFSAAATRLHLSQPAVHLRVKNLADELGAALYERRGRRLVLSEIGVRVLAYGRDALTQRDAFLADLGGEGRAPRVTVCAGEGSWLYLLPRALKRARGVRAKLDAMVRDAAGTLEAVQTGVADVGVLPLARVPAELEAIDLARVGSVVVMRREHALASHARLKPRALDGERIVVPPAGQPRRRALDEALESAGVRCEIAAEAPGWPLQIELVALGFGVAIVNDLCALPAGLVAVPLAGRPTLVYRAVRRRRRGHPAACDALWTTLAEAARQVTERSTPLPQASSPRTLGGATRGR